MNLPIPVTVARVRPFNGKFDFWCRDDAGKVHWLMGRETAPQEGERGRLVFDESLGVKGRWVFEAAN